MAEKNGVSESDILPYLLGMSVTDGEPEEKKEEDTPPPEYPKARHWPHFAMPLDIEC